MAKAKVKKISKAVDEEVAEEELMRTGENCSLYISKKAMDILKRCRKTTRRSRSMLVSLFVEKYGPELEANPSMLGL